MTSAPKAVAAVPTPNFVPTCNEPVESKVLVAVPPKYAFWNMESCVDDALLSERRDVEVEYAKLALS